MDPSPYSEHAVPTVVDGDFEWDEDKADANLAKHGVSFDDAQLVFLDPFSYFADDGSNTAGCL